MKLMEYLYSIVQRQRQRPASDLLGALIAAEESGDALSAEERLESQTLHWQANQVVRGLQSLPVLF